MALTITLGQNVNFLIDGHSAINGADLPDTATIALTSSDPTVATVPATATVPTGGAKEVVVPVTGVAAGSTTISATVTLADGTVMPCSDSLIVNPVAVPGLTHVTGTLVVAP